MTPGQKTGTVVSATAQDGTVEFKAVMDRGLEFAILTCLNSEDGRNGALEIARAVIAAFEGPSNGRRTRRKRHAVIPTGKPILRAIQGGKGVRAQQ